MEQSVSAAEKFILAVDSAIEMICKSPQLFRNVYKEYYEVSLKKYPYTVIYTIDPDRKLVTIRSIYHHKRNPNKKYKDRSL